VNPQFFIFGGLLVVYMGFTSVNPIFAPLARELGLSEVQAGFLISISALAFTLFSSPWGRRSEVWGRKPVFLVGLTGFGLGFALFGGVAQLGLAGWFSLPLLVALLGLSRFCVGALTAAAPVAAQAYIADTTSGPERSAGIALLGAANGLGLIGGPVLAAALVGFGLLVPYYVTAAIAFLGALIVWWGLPTGKRVSTPRATVPAKVGLWDGRVWPFLLVGFLTLIALVTAQVTAGFYFQDKLGLTSEGAAQAVGFALFASGVAIVLTQAGIIRALKPAPVTLLRLGLPLTLASFVVMTLSPTLTLLIVAYALLGFGVGFILPGYISGASLAVGEHEQGAVAGLVGTAQGFGSVLGPLLGTTLYTFGITLPYIVVALLLLVLTGFVWSKRMLTPPLPAAVDKAPTQGLRR
jgi:MFS family permease